MTYLTFGTDEVELTLDSDTSSMAGVIESLVHQNTTEYLVPTKGYGFRWGAFEEGQELAQGGVLADHAISNGGLEYADPATVTIEELTPDSLRLTLEDLPRHDIEDPRRIGSVEMLVKAGFESQPRIIEVQTITRMREETSGVDLVVSEFDGNRRWGITTTILPHMAHLGPILHVPHEIGQFGYILDVSEEKSATQERFNEQSVLDGGPVWANGDGSRAIGLYSFDDPPPAHNVLERRTRYRRSSQVENQRFRELAQIERAAAAPYPAADRFHRSYVVVGTIPQIWSDFRFLHNWWVFERENRKVVYRAPSAIVPTPISLTSA